MSIITAKFPGTCTTCGNRFAAGERINYEKGRGAQHVTCPAAATAPTELTRIEYQTGVGQLGACYAVAGQREQEFVDQAAAYNKISTEQVRERLARGEELVFEWFGEVGPYHLRDGAITEALTKIARAQRDAARARHNAVHPRMRCRSCGATGNTGAYPFSTNPSSGLCDDCV